VSEKSEWSDDSLICPHCGYQRYDDLYDFYEDGYNGDTECEKCEKHFRFSVSVTWMFESRPIVTEKEA